MRINFAGIDDRENYRENLNPSLRVNIRSRLILLKFALFVKLFLPFESIDFFLRRYNPFFFSFSIRERGV